jgi:hypothetical protein
MEVKTSAASELAGVGGGPAGAASPSGLTASAGSDLNVKTKSYRPVNPVLSVTGRPETSKSICTSCAIGWPPAPKRPGARRIVPHCGLLGSKRGGPPGVPGRGARPGPGSGFAARAFIVATHSAEDGLSARPSLPSLRATTRLYIGSCRDSVRSKSLNRSFSRFSAIVGSAFNGVPSGAFAEIVKRSEFTHSGPPASWWSCTRSA